MGKNLSAKNGELSSDVNEINWSILVNEITAAVWPKEIVMPIKCMISKRPMMYSILRKKNFQRTAKGMKMSKQFKPSVVRLLDGSENGTSSVIHHGRNESTSDLLNESKPSVPPHIPKPQSQDVPSKDGMPKSKPGNGNGKWMVNDILSWLFGFNSASEMTTLNFYDDFTIHKDLYFLPFL